MPHLTISLLAGGAAAALTSCSAQAPVAASAADDAAVAGPLAAAGGEPDPLAQIERMKAAIRADATASYGGRCLGILLPDSAFVPVEITGGGHRELAVFYAHAECPRMGASGFSGSGGSLVQLWGIADSEAPARLLLEHDMNGFTPGDGELVSYQHGGYCGVSGALGCRIVYRWRDGRFETAERRAGDPDRPLAEAWAYDGWRNPPLPNRQRTGFTGAAVSEPEAAQIERMKLVIRRDAQLNYGDECGLVTIPDRAFMTVEITGDDFPELAVKLNLAECPAQGLTRFSGSGGVGMQFWHMERTHDGRTGPVRLLLERQMHGFTPQAGGLVTLQHGGACPGGAGPDQCRVVYRWDERGRRLERAERRLASQLGTFPAMAYGYEAIAR